MHIGKGAVIKNSIILSYTDIGDGAHIENAVVDKWVKVNKVKRIISENLTPAYVKRNDVL